MRTLPGPLLVITDRRQARGPLEEVVRAAIDGGARWISLREKDLPPAERRALLRRLQEIAAPTGTALMVHEDIEAASCLGLAGIHLPSGADPAAARAALGAGPLIGISAHGLAEAAEAARRGADYVTLSPIFPSASKPGYGPALGLDALAATVRAAGCPVVALGGVDAETAGGCRRAGAAAVAMMGPVMRAADPAAEVRRALAALRA